ncbi:MAG: signal peptidase I [Clostridia bacterium]|nr:signal peptidase I [Clostridia bacterium]
MEENKKTKKIVLKISKIAFNTVIWTVLILMILLVTLSAVSQKGNIFGYRIYTIVSGSMEPIIKTQDAVIVKEEKDLQEGDIIAFEIDNSITIHRITKIYTENDEKLYQTKGDKNNGNDKDAVHESQIKGKYQATLYGLGPMIIFLQKRLIILIILIALLLLIEIIKIII